MKIYKRKDGRYQCNVTIKLIDGTTKRKPFYHRDKNELKKIVKKAEYQAEQYIDDEGMSLGTFINEWFKMHQKKIAATTAEGYRINIDKHIIPALGKYKLSQLRLFILQEFINKKSINYKPKTLKQMKSILSRCLDDAVRNGNIQSNPCDYLEIPDTGYKFKYTDYTEDDFSLLINCIKGTSNEIPVILAGVCGFRRGEILGLQWSDIDFDNNTISIKRTVVVANREIIVKDKAKTESSIRTISIPGNVMDFLKQSRGIGFVVSDRQGNPLNGRTFSRHFRDVLKKHNLKLIRFHDLRHFHATLLLEMGIDIKLVSSRLGHSNTSTTQNIYQHATSKMDKIIADELNKKIIL